MTLTAGTRYVLAGVTGSADPFVYDVQDGGGNAALTTDPSITYLQDRYAVGSTLAFPGSTDGYSEPGFFGPNFLSRSAAPAPAVPEPSALAPFLLGGLGLGGLGLGGLGLGGLGLTARRRSRAPPLPRAVALQMSLYNRTRSKGITMLSTSLHRTARALGLLSVGVLSTLGALSLAHTGPASAQSPGVNLAALVAQVNTLQSQQKTDEATITSQGKTITSLQSSLSGVQSKQTTDEGSIGKLQTLTAPLSLSSDPSAGGTNTLLTISGVNVQIVNGMGSTATTNGLGNLIVGYDELRGNNRDARTGSHNTVTGIYNSFTFYGGLMGGYANTLSGSYEFAVGASNTAGGDLSSVGGGQQNTASGRLSSVSGGAGLTQNTQYGWAGGSYHTP